MIPKRDILKALLEERPVQTVESLKEEFYEPSIAELRSSKLFECVDLDDASIEDFSSYFIFPRDGRSLRVNEGYDKGYYKGRGLALYLSIWHPIAVYGAMSASTGPHHASSERLGPETVQTLPSPDWADIERALMEILLRHSITVMTREEAAAPLTSLGLPPPAESNTTNDTDRVFFALFNNAY